MEMTEIVMKLIGDINPKGDASRDDQIFENLKSLCELVDNLVGKIDNVNYENEDSKEFSVKRSADFAKNFLTETLGIK